MIYFAADISDAVLAAIVTGIGAAFVGLWGMYRLMVNKVLSVGNDFKSKCARLEAEVDEMRERIQQCSAIDCIFRSRTGPQPAHSLPPAAPITPLPRYMRKWKPTPPQPT